MNMLFLWNEGVLSFLDIFVAFFSSNGNATCQKPTVVEKKNKNFINIQNVSAIEICIWTFHTYFIFKKSLYLC